jgi:hypothetical protein
VSQKEKAAAAFAAAKARKATEKAEKNAAEAAKNAATAASKSQGGKAYVAAHKKLLAALEREEQLVRARVAHARASNRSNLKNASAMEVRAKAAANEVTTHFGKAVRGGTRRLRKSSTV